MKKQFLYSTLTACLLSMNITSFTHAEAFSNEIKTQQGIVKGSYDTKHQAVEWLGIPYAAPATGENRFKAPQKALKHTEILDCTKAAPANMQTKGKNVIGKEGILTLDIVRPNTDEKNLPVLVFIHGGNNQASNSRLLIGNKLAQEGNMVYVSMQYRLGLLGFNNLPALQTGSNNDKSGNYGFLDQAAALEWLQKNISKFGGNPKNITVSGFSAGGRDVMAMLISPNFKGKFAKAISFSGGLTVANAQDSQKVIAKQLAPLVVEDGKAENTIKAQEWLLNTDKATKASVRNYLQNIKAERIAPIMAGAVIRMSAFPHLYGDGKVLPVEGFNSKKYYSVPIMMLTASDEFSSFAARDAFFNKRLKEINVNPTTTQEFTYANKYGSKLYGLFNGQESAETIYPHYKNNIYVCTFNFAHTPELVGKKYTTRTGAMHGIFMPFLTDQPYPFSNKQQGFDTEGAKDLSKEFIASISAFMRTGNPNTPTMKNTWVNWTPENHAEMVFDAKLDKANLYLANNYLKYEDVLAELDADNSISASSKETITHSVLGGRWFSERLDKHYNNVNMWEK